MDSCSQSPNEPYTFTDHWLGELDTSGHRQVLTLFEIALVVLNNRDLLSCGYLSVKFQFIFIMLLLFSEMKVEKACHLRYYTCCFNSLCFFGRWTDSSESGCREKLCSGELLWAHPWPCCLHGPTVTPARTYRRIHSCSVTIVTVFQGWKRRIETFWFHFLKSD